MGLESLNILFFLINATGMLPSRMILDHKTGRFQRSNISGWRCPATWWFFFITACHVIWAPTVLFFQLTTLFTYQESVVYLMVIFLWQISYALVKFSPLLLLLYVGELKAAIEIIWKVDQALENVPHKPCNSKRRTVMAIVLATIAVCMISYRLPNQIEIHDCRSVDFRRERIGSSTHAGIQYKAWNILRGIGRLL